LHHVTHPCHQHQLLQELVQQIHFVDQRRQLHLVVVVVAVVEDQLGKNNNTNTFLYKNQAIYKLKQHLLLIYIQ
jgi:hypothetical protein